MLIFVKILLVVIAALHLYFLWFEMFAWETRGPKIFKSFPAELFTPTKSMAANQGLYNGFLSAGLIWSLFIDDQIWQVNVAIFFLSCVVVAGIFGTMTASKKIFFVQALPALIALLFIAMHALLNF